MFSALKTRIEVCQVWQVPLMDADIYANFYQPKVRTIKPQHIIGKQAVVDVVSNINIK